LLSVWPLSVKRLMEHLHNGNKQSESSGCFYMEID